MNELNLNLTHVLISNVNVRSEASDDAQVLAMDISMSTVLSDIEPLGLSGWWSNVQSIKLATALENHVVSIVDMFHDIALLACKLTKFSLELDDDGYLLKFQASQSNPDDADMIAISHLLQSRVEVAIQPEASQARPAEPPASDLMDEIEGKDQGNVVDIA